MMLIKTPFFLLLLISFTFWNCQSNNQESQNQKRPPNILFIAIDDLRTELGCYGNPVVKSPNLDQLAKEGTLFTNHFVSVPTCGASRFALLTGLYPKTTAHLRNDAPAKFLSEKPESETPETFIHHLKRNGYYTVGVGKISHHPDGLVYPYGGTPENAPLELPHSWDEMLLDIGNWGTGWNTFFGYAGGKNRTTEEKMVKPYEAAAVEDVGYPDGLTTNVAIEKLKELKEKDQPFFMGVGYFKPHLPFTAPQKYWDLYDREKIAISPAPDIPQNVNRASLHNNGEFGNYKLGEEKATLDERVSDEYARKLRHGYYACISYIDNQVGLVISELERLGLAENTIVVVWGDHGWNLGDHRIWGKHTCFEWSLKSTLILKDPRIKNGIKADQIVSTVDLYPTLMELCGVDMPYDSDGHSLTGFLQNETIPDWRNRAHSYFKKGITVRTAQYRLTKYYREEEPTLELFDHQTDPYEMVNIAGENEVLVQQLMPKLEEGNTGLYDVQ